MYSEKEYDEFVEKLEKDFPAMFAQPYGGVAVCPGWWTIVRQLCVAIDYYLDCHKDVPQVTVAQIKEKFGGLRFYYDGGDDYIAGLVTMAESWASRACEECGKPGHQRDGGWIRTLCDEHEAERQERMKNAR